MRRNGISAFVLIELLIAVAFVAILAAMAFSNYLEAQNRSKISRVRSNMRGLALALEAYRADCRIYPFNLIGNAQMASRDLVALTTPVAYIASLATAEDPFMPFAPKNNPIFKQFGYFNLQHTPRDVDSRVATNWIDYLSPTYSKYATTAWTLRSLGPDRAQSNGEWFYICIKANIPAQGYAFLYDPTNGTLSSGDIIRMGGDIGHLPAVQ